jgi:sugar phosphate isomerase/epimerase
MKTSATVTLVPTLSEGPWIYWEDLGVSISKAKHAGFDAVELFPASAEAIQIQELARLLEQYQMTISAFGSGAGKALFNLHLTSPNESLRLEARSFIASLIDVAAQFGAPVIIGSMQGSLEKNVTRPRALDWLADALNELGERAKSQGVKLLFEPLNRYETDIINRIADGARLVRSLSTDNVALLADLFHMNIEEISLPTAIRAAAGDIGFVHLADSNRRAAGFGHIDFAAVFEAFHAISYNGYLSAEVFPYPHSDHAAAQTISTCRAFGLGGCRPSHDWRESSKASGGSETIRHNLGKRG